MLQLSMYSFCLQCINRYIVSPGKNLIPCYQQLASYILNHQLHNGYKSSCRLINLNLLSSYISLMQLYVYEIDAVHSYYSQSNLLEGLQHQQLHQLSFPTPPPIAISQQLNIVDVFFSHTMMMLISTQNHSYQPYRQICPHDT